MKLEPKEETKKLLLRLIQAVQGDRVPEDMLESTLDTCTEDLELIWSGKDDGSRWTIGMSELKGAFNKDPDLGLDESGEVILKDKS